MLSHPLGRQWLNKQLHEKDPEMVPHPLPDQDQLAALIADLPLHIVEYVDEDKLYMVLLQVSIKSIIKAVYYLLSYILYRQQTPL